MIINTAIVYASLFALSGLEFILAMIYPLIPRERRLRLCSDFEQLGTRVLFGLFRVFRGFRVQVSFPPNLIIPKRCLVIANHQSLLDILVLTLMLGPERMPRFVAKKELQYGIPLVSFCLRKGGHCLIKRHGAPIDTMRAITHMAKVCKESGASPVVFPEGTRSRNGVLKQFHSAGVRRILEVDPLPVLAVSIDGGWRVATLRDFLRRFGKERYEVAVVALYPVPKGKSAIERVLEDARGRIAETLERERFAGNSASR